MALAGFYLFYLFAEVSSFTNPLSSREIDVGIAKRLSNYGKWNGRLRLPGAYSQIWTNNFYGGFVNNLD
jgi:hypothetical protein